MAGGGSDLGFVPAVDDLRRPSCQPGDNGGINFRHHRLFGAEASSDPGFDHPDLGLRDIQGVGDDSSHMKGHLGGGRHHQAAVGIHGSKGPESLHHSLLIGLGVVSLLNHMLTPGQYSLHVSVPVLAGCAEIAPVIRSHRAEALPVLLRMDQHRIILRRPEVQHRFQHLVVHTDSLQRLIHRFLRLSCHNSRRIPHKPYPLIQNQTVIGAGLRVGLPGHGKPLPRHILPGEHRGDSRNLLRRFFINLFYQGMGMRATQHFHHQTVLRGDVVGVHRFPRHQGHGVLLHHRTSHNFSCSLHRRVLLSGSDISQWPASVPYNRYTGTDCPPGIPGFPPLWGKPVLSPWPAHS